LTGHLSGPRWRDRSGEKRGIQGPEKLGSSPWENEEFMERSTIFHGKVHYFYGDFP